MKEPGHGARDRELADSYDAHRDTSRFGDPKPVQAAERLDVTISVRFTPAEVTDVRSWARAAGMKPTSSIRRCALEREDAPLDRTELARSIESLSNEVESLRHAAG